MGCCQSQKKKESEIKQAVNAQIEENQNNVVKKQPPKEAYSEKKPEVEKHREEQYYDKSKEKENNTNLTPIINKNVEVNKKANKLPDKKEITLEIKAIDKITNSTIYIIKNDIITFNVSGKWKFIKSLSNVDFNGHKDADTVGSHYLGALMGKLGNEVFLISDNLEKKFKNSGQLLIYPNIEDIVVEPSGSLKITVSGAHEISKNHKIETFERLEFPEDKFSFFEVFAADKKEEKPLFVKKGEKLNFYVRGLWSFSDGAKVDFNGDINIGNKNEGNNIGQLMGEIEGENFAITDNFSYTCKKSGQLSLYPNVGRFELEPLGSLRVYVEGGNKAENSKILEQLMKKEIPQNSIELKIDACDKEQDFSIWIEKGKEIKFYVKGKWKVSDNMDLVNYNGSEEFGKQHRGFNIGALVGKVLGNKNYFLVSDELTYKSPFSGPITFQMNNSNFVLAPSGSISVFIVGAEKKTQEQIEFLLGYDLNKLDTAKTQNYLTKEEKRQFLVLNKIRTNPSRFADLYLIHRIKDPGFAEETYQELKNTKPIQAIYPSKGLYNAAKDHAKDMGDHGKEGHVSTNGDDLGIRIKRYGQFEVTCGENCAYGHEDGLTTVLQLLIDDGVETRGHRKNILNPEFAVAGISIYKHKTYNWNCVHDYAGGMIEKK